MMYDSNTTITLDKTLNKYNFSGVITLDKSLQKLDFKVENYNDNHDPKSGQFTWSDGSTPTMSRFTAIKKQIQDRINSGEKVSDEEINAALDYKQVALAEDFKKKYGSPQVTVKEAAQQAMGAKYPKKQSDYKRGKVINTEPELGNQYEAIGNDPLYRSVTIGDLKRIQKQGYVDTDGRETIIAAVEGVNLANNPDTSSYYIPRGEKGVILTIKPDNLNLFMIDQDSYIRTQDKIPLENITAISKVIGHAEEGYYVEKAKNSVDGKVENYNENHDPKSGRFSTGDGGSLAVAPPMTVDTSYRGQHGAPNREDEVSSPGHNLADTFPADIYSADAARRYSSGYKEIDQEAVDIIHSIHNKPNAKVTVYRAVPNEASIEVIHPGDWIAITRGYADMHGESNLNDDYKVLVKTVRAKDIWNNADSIQEWGYDPTVDKNYLDEVVKNYNENHDPKSGRFSGSGAGGMSVDYEQKMNESLKKEAAKHDSLESFTNSMPLVYHGSSEPLERFNNDQGTFFTDDMMNADGYGNGENIYEGHLYLMNPYVVDAKGSMWNDIKTPDGTESTVDIVGGVDQNKHDGVIFKNVKDNWIDDAEAQDPGTIYYAYRPADSFLNDEQLQEIYDNAHAKNAVQNAKVGNPYPHDPKTGWFGSGGNSPRAVNTRKTLAEIYKKFPAIKKALNDLEAAESLTTDEKIAKLEEQYSHASREERFMSDAKYSLEANIREEGKGYEETKQDPRYKAAEAEHDRVGKVASEKWQALNTERELIKNAKWLTKERLYKETYGDDWKVKMKAAADTLQQWGENKYATAKKEIKKDNYGALELEHNLTQAYYAKQGKENIDIYWGLYGDSAQKIIANEPNIKADITSVTDDYSVAESYAQMDRITSGTKRIITNKTKDVPQYGVVVKHSIPVQDVIVSHAITTYGSVYAPKEAETDFATPGNFMPRDKELLITIPKTTEVGSYKKIPTNEAVFNMNEAIKGGKTWGQVV